MSPSSSETWLVASSIIEHAVLDPDLRERHLIFGAGLHGARDGLDERRPVALAIAVPDDADMRPQHHDVGDLEPPQQQWQQAQIRGQHVDLKRGIDGAASLQPDIVKADIAAGKYRDVDRAADDQIEPGDGADLRLDRFHGVHPGSGTRTCRSGRSKPSRRNAAIGIPRRFIPWAIVKDISGSG